MTYNSGLGDNEDVFVVHTVRGPLRFGAGWEGLYSATAASLAALSLIPIPPQGQPLTESTRRAATQTRTEESRRMSALEREQRRTPRA